MKSTWKGKLNGETTQIDDEDMAMLLPNFEGLAIVLLRYKLELPEEEKEAEQSVMLDTSRAVEP